MRRSRSYSNIPLPTFRKNSSNENLSNTSQVQKPKQSLTRSNSSNNLQVPKLSYSRHDVASSSKPSGSRSSTKRFTATPLRHAGSSSVCSRKSSTPLVHAGSSSMCGGKSSTPYSTSKLPHTPSVMLKTDLINDKKFSSDQYRKICTFMQENVENFDSKSLKPLSLSSFVYAISILFSKIDPRLKIDMANYKEVVFKYLKLYKYPGPVSMSLLKTANTSISWNQIMSIFGWLVDLVHDLTTPVEKDLLEEYILCKVHNALRSGPETKGLFIDLIEQELQFDRKEYNELQGQVETLRKEVEERRQSIMKREKEEKKLSEKYEKMKSEIKEFKEDNLEEKIKKEISELQSEVQNKVIKIDEMKKRNNDERQKISKQKYTLEEKKDLQQKLEDSKYSLSLKKEELEKISQLKYENDHKLTNSRRQIEAEIYKLNGRLMQFNTGDFIDDPKKLRLPDRGIHKPNFTEELEEKKECLENFQQKMEAEVQKKEKSLSKKKIELKNVCDNIQEVAGKIDSAKEEKSKFATEISRVLFEFDVVKKQYEVKMNKLRLEAPNTESQIKIKSETQAEISSLTETLERLKREFIEIYQKLQEETQNEAKQMMTIMEETAKQILTIQQMKLEQATEIDNMLSEEQ